MELLAISISDFDDTTVTVAAKEAGVVEVFHVQTYEGKHNSTVGCWILNDNTDGDVDVNKFPQFNFDVIVEEAENFIN